MIITPDFIMPFGVNKGYSLAEIYKYSPTYIEWLIIYIPEFEIKTTDFQDLPDPTIYYNVGEIMTTAGTKVPIRIQISHKGSIEVIKNSGHLMKVKYEFSDNIKNILLQKEGRIYEAPSWEKLEDAELFSIKEIIEYLNKNKS